MNQTHLLVKTLTKQLNSCSKDLLEKLTVSHSVTNLRDFRLPPQCAWVLRSFWILQGIQLWFLTNVSGQIVVPIFKGPIRCPETSVGNYHYRLSKILTVCISQSINSPKFHWTRRFITVFTTARPLSLSWARYSPRFSIYVLVLQVSLASGTAPKPCMIFRLPGRATCSSHSILLKFMAQSLTTYLKFHFKVLPASMTMCPASSTHGFWKMCYAHWLHPFVLHVLLSPSFLIWSTH